MPRTPGFEMFASVKTIKNGASPSLASLLRHAVRRLVGERSGIAAIEFAVLLPSFAGLIYMIAQIGLYFYFSTTLYYVTAKATRQILTGSVATQGLTAAQYRTNILCPLLPGGMSCSNIITNIQVVPSWSGYTSGGFYSLTNITTNPSNPLGYTMTGLTAPPMNNNNTSFCIGSAGSIVIAQVFYAMPVLGISAMLNNVATFNGQSVIFINATSVFKNEPFATTPTSC
jgi:Flp pilus assembly protein TadG